jgi:hypothetical protein
MIKAGRFPYEKQLIPLLICRRTYSPVCFNFQLLFSLSNDDKLLKMQADVKEFHFAVRNDKININVVLTEENTYGEKISSY